MTATAEFPVLVRDFTQDAMCVEQVIRDNEYRLPETFTSDDVIVDIGSNIGTFALACLERGAGEVVCVEPCPKNCHVLRQNLARYGSRARVIEAACWRSDLGHPILRLFDRGDGLTAMPYIAPRGRPVESISLDDILRGIPAVRLLKVDCEGSEYAALCTSKELGRVQEIAGELHLQMNLTPDIFYNSPAGLKKFLTKQGFETEIVPHAGDAEYLSLFFARRK